MDLGLSSSEFLKMQKYIEDHCGIAISEEKAYLIESRLSKMLIDFGLFSFEDFFKRIIAEDDPAVAEKIIDAITTNETLWFRDSIPWSVLEDVLLPVYVKQLREKQKSKIRIWSAACSTGQEPYSIAMCIDNYLVARNITDVGLPDFEIVASDISRTVLDIASAGKYDNISIMRGLDEKYKNRYFQNEGRVWSLNQRIKDAVSFRRFNLQKSFSAMGKFDVIFCRYVIIYFSEKLKRETLEKAAGSLNAGGVLIIGSSELITGYEGSLVQERHGNGIFYRVKE